jgi:hypothetical protein
MTAITVVYTDQITIELDSDMDYESIVFWARERVEYNGSIEEIIVDFEEGRMIFKRIY